jgi:hypothetical protein
MGRLFSIPALVSRWHRGRAVVHRLPGHHPPAGAQPLILAPPEPHLAVLRGHEPRAAQRFGVKPDHRQQGRQRQDVDRDVVGAGDAVEKPARRQLGHGQRSNAATRPLQHVASHVAPTRSCHLKNGGNPRKLVPVGLHQGFAPKAAVSCPFSAIAPPLQTTSSLFRRTPCPGLPLSRAKGRAFPTPLRQPRSPEPPAWNAPAWSKSFSPVTRDARLPQSGSLERLLPDALGRNPELCSAPGPGQSGPMPGDDAGARGSLNPTRSPIKAVRRGCAG